MLFTKKRMILMYNIKNSNGKTRKRFDIQNVEPFLFSRVPSILSVVNLGKRNEIKTQYWFVMLL